MTRLALARQGGAGFFAFPYISQIIYLPGHAFENANVTPPIGAKTTHEFVSGTKIIERNRATKAAAKLARDEALRTVLEWLQYTELNGGFQNGQWQGGGQFGRGPRD